MSKNGNDNVVDFMKVAIEKAQAELAEHEAAVEGARREVFDAYAEVMRTFPAKCAGTIAAKIGTDPGALREDLEEQVEAYIREREAELFGKE